MRRLQLVLVVAAASSALTAAAISIPASAEDDARDRPRTFALLAPSGERPNAARIAEFKRCMAERGFELGDDVTIRITPDGVTIDGKEVDAREFRRARRACGPLFPHLRGRFRAHALPEGERRERMEKLRECLREEGA